ncbi:MAG: hypothetical protein M0R23_08475 [Bacteroidales bacterium]|nr:hypothetical protein [Bacteroidales bacterium]
MKKFIFYILFFFLGIQCFSQEIRHNVKDDLAEYILDSVKYVMKDFSDGNVIFQNGEMSKGLLNICVIDQTLRFLSPEGEILKVNNENTVSSVSIKGRSFLKNRSLYIELLEMSDDIVLGVARKITFLEQEKEGAYGKASPTTSVSTMTTYSDGGRTVNLGEDIVTPFRYKEIPYLYKNGIFYVAKKKYFQKFFPEKKKKIESYINENKVNFDEMEDVKALFLFLSQN